MAESGPWIPGEYVGPFAGSTRVSTENPETHVAVEATREAIQSALMSPEEKRIAAAAEAASLPVQPTWRTSKQ